MNFKLVLAEPLDNSLGSHVETFLKQHGGPGLQHIGLTTDKATETVQIMLDKGAQFRKPPPTYYQLVKLSKLIIIIKTFIFNFFLLGFKGQRNP